VADRVEIFLVDKFNFKPVTKNLSYKFTAQPVIELDSYYVRVNDSVAYDVYEMQGSVTKPLSKGEYTVSADGMDIDGDSRSVLAAVADFEMKRVCGRNADRIVIVYDNPSFEVMRPTPYFDYRIEAEGATMREYGFRCVYNK
jgi:hypothetical protein